MNVFIEPTISQTEEEIVIKALQDPAVRKYLQLMAIGVGRDIAFSAPSPGQDVQEFLRNIAQAQGKLHLIHILLQVGQETEQPST